jgi:hypothetical protein
VNFLKAYFTIYDSDDRQPLMDAYSDEVCFQSYMFNRPKNGTGNKEIKKNNSYFYTCGITLY